MEWQDLNSWAELSRNFSCRVGREFSAEVNDLTDVVVGELRSDSCRLARL